MIETLCASVVVLRPDVVGVAPGDDRQLRELVHHLLGPGLPDGAVTIPISGHDPTDGVTHLVNLNKTKDFLNIKIVAL